MNTISVHRSAGMMCKMSKAWCIGYGDNVSHG
jgi:hypothetical protein